jgi:hypothetical protein
LRRILVHKDLLTHCLKLFKNVVPLLFSGIQLCLNFVDLIINIIVKLLIELVFNILRQIVVKILLRELRLWELRKACEIGRILETLHIHHVWELEVRTSHLIVVVVHLSIVHVSELVDVVVSRLVILSNLPKLIRWDHEVVLLPTIKIRTILLLSVALHMVNYVLNIM